MDDDQLHIFFSVHYLAEKGWLNAVLGGGVLVLHGQPHVVSLLAVLVLDVDRVVAGVLLGQVPENNISLLLSESESEPGSSDCFPDTETYERIRQ